MKNDLEGIAAAAEEVAKLPIAAEGIDVVSAPLSLPTAGLQRKTRANVSVI